MLMIIGAIAGIALAVVGILSGIVFIVFFITKMSAKLDAVAADMSELVRYVRGLGERTAKLEGRVDELSRHGIPPSKMENEKSLEE